MAVKVLLRVEVSVCQAPLDAGPDLFLMCVIKPVPSDQGAQVTRLDTSLTSVKGEVGERKIG